jgi:putative ABC transport system permease protein
MFRLRTLLVDTIACDLRYAARVLARSPGVTAVAVLSLGIGIGANAAIFAVVDAFMFRPAPVKNADRLVALADRSDKYAGYPISYPDFADWKARNHVFEEMAAYRNRSRVLGDDEGAERIRELDVSEGFLRVVGVSPVVGRDFLPAEHVEGAAAVALIGHELWLRRFAGDRAAIGRTITLDGRPFTVIGVLPAGFNVGARAEVLTAIAQWRGTREPRGAHNSLYAIARLKPGATRSQARSELDVIAASLEREHPDTNKSRRVDILPFGHVRMREASTPLFLLMAAVGFVLLIACANISNLLLSRSASRGREMAIRRAIGAGRARLFQQLLTESLLLASLGGGLGLLLGEWGCRALVALAGDLGQWPGGEAVSAIHVDSRVFLFTLGVSACAGVVSGLVPAFQASKGDLTPPLKEGTRAAAGAQARWLRGSLVVLEVALALMLLTGAGLVIRTLHLVLTGDTGFDARHVLAFSLTAGAGRVQGDQARFEASNRRVVEEIQSLPGVTVAAVAFPLPFGRGFSADCFHVDGRPVPAAKGCPDALVRQVSPGYAAALGMRVTRGRWFTETDDGFGAAINETMARVWWPGEDAVGKRFRLGTSPRFSPWYTVLGVVANTKENGLDTARLSEIYVRRYGGGDVLVRTAGNPLALVPAIRARIRGAAPGRSMFDVQPLEAMIAESVRDRRTLTALLAVFAGIALVLAAVGIYGVVSFSVARRTREVGLRMALGASRGDVVKDVLARGMAPVAVGTLVGGVASYWAARAMTGFLYGIAPTDPATFGGVVLIFGLVAFVACLIPARRATRVDPAVVLRCE